MSIQDQLIEFVTGDIIEMITIDLGIEFDEAMNKFYNSEVFEKLQDIETGLYAQSPAYVYDLFKDEIKFGHIIQAEIQTKVKNNENEYLKGCLDRKCSMVLENKLEFRLLYSVEFPE